MIRYILFLILIYSLVIQGQSEFWQRHSLAGPISNLVITDEDIFYTATSDFIYRSTDLGKNWTIIYTNTDQCEYWKKIEVFVDTCYGDEDRLILKHSNGSSSCQAPSPLISTNSGKTWHIFNVPESWSYPSFDSNGFIYIVSDTLYRSFDNGETWYKVNAPKESLSKFAIDIYNNFYVSSTGSFTDPVSWWTFRWEEVYRSTDRGKTWQWIFQTNQNPYSNLLNLFTTSTGDVFASQSEPDRLNHYKNNSVKSYPFHGVASAIAVENQIFTSTSGCCINQGINYSNNLGNTWMPLNLGLTSGETGSLATDKNGYLYVATGDGIFRSKFSIAPYLKEAEIIFPDAKLGDTVSVSANFRNFLENEIIIDSVKLSDDRFFIANIPTRIASKDSSTINFGFTPDSLKEYSTNAIFYCGDLLYNVPIKANCPKPELIAVVPSIWGPVEPYSSITNLVQIKNRSLNDLIIDSIGLTEALQFVIEDADYPILIKKNSFGECNILFRPNRIGFIYDSLIIYSNALNNPYKIRIMGRGITVTDIKKEENTIEFYLHQNYPNPFNSSTFIEFSLPSACSTELKLYDYLGQEISVLLNANLNKGVHKVNFDAEEFYQGNKKISSGIYFYVLKADNKIISRKLILMK